MLDERIEDFIRLLQREEEQAVLEQLADLPPEVLPGIVEACRELMDRSDPDRRWWAARLLAEILHPAAGDLLADTLNDDDLAVRQCAALALRQQPHSAAIAPLADALVDSAATGDPLLSRLAADALAAHGPAAVPRLLDVLNNGPAGARVQAARALSLIGDTRAVPDLIAALDRDSALLEHYAGQALERMGVGMAYFIPA